MSACGCMCIDCRMNDHCCRLPCSVGGDYPPYFDPALEDDQ